MDSAKIKVVIVGDARVGKTTFVNRHRTGDFKEKYVATMGVEVSHLTFMTTNGQAILDIWDCSGNDKIGSCEYHTGFQAAIIMFDVTSKISYANVSIWYDKLVSKLPNIPIVLCGNKCDVKERTVRPKDISFHRQKGLQYYDISAKSNYNFEKPFIYILRKICGSDISIEIPVVSPIHDNYSDLAATCPFHVGADEEIDAYCTMIKAALQNIVFLTEEDFKDVGIVRRVVREGALRFNAVVHICAEYSDWADRKLVPSHLIGKRFRVIQDLVDEVRNLAELIDDQHVSFNAIVNFQCAALSLLSYPVIIA